MNKTKQHIHLNSNIENVGSEPFWSEGNSTPMLRRKTHRYGEIAYNFDFSENFRELVAMEASQNSVNSDTVWERYKKFLKLFTIHSFRFERCKYPTIFRPMWYAFLDFENGGEEGGTHPLMFKEDIYSDAYYTSLNKKLFGE